MPQNVFKHRKLMRWLTGGLAVVMMAAIFFFSSQNGDTSHETSAGVTELIIRIIYPGYANLTGSEAEAAFTTAEYFIRKVGHFSEYALLAFLLRLMLDTWDTKHRATQAWLGATLYAATDEFHQMFVGARSAMWQDVVIDSSGALAGTAVAFALLVMILRFRKMKSSRMGVNEHE